MFDFKEELKYYEPGLETVETSMSGDADKDLVELMKVLLQAKPDPLAAKNEEKAVNEDAKQEQTEEASLVQGEQKEPEEA